MPVVIGPVETSPRSTSPKLTPLPDTPNDARDLILKPAANEPRPAMRRPAPNPAPAPVADLLAQLSSPKRHPQTDVQPMLPAIDEAEREALIDSVMRGILDDPDAGFRSIAVLYQDFLVRCRISRVPGEPLALPAFRRRLAVARASVDQETAAGEAWQRALALSESLSDDIQGVFLVVAQAAVTGNACPSDATLARAYGSHSPSRARRLLTYFEEQGMLIVSVDFRGSRVVIFPDLGCETAPGDPNRPDDLAQEQTAAE